MERAMLGVSLQKNRNDEIRSRTKEKQVEVAVGGSVIGPMAIGADVFWSGDRESVSAVSDDLQPAAQMTLKRWLEAAG
ncbi:jg16510 [Pararge aegeria aegeria]|uniref:Jg16510 protein n=1 Tax=Pararge aegeria aegeria TaxID=348720 RepID=A0A8S4S5M1_9NEOP|nr:jg16510 [Pararge aegeria aegeria]